MNILVLCTGNSCRSQMAHGYLEHFLGERANIYSAGIETHGVNARAVTIMREDSIDISHHTSNHVDEYAEIRFDYVITVCDHAAQRCPVFIGVSKTLHHNFPDPAKAQGSQDEICQEFRRVRDMIRDFCVDFSKSLSNG